MSEVVTLRVPVEGLSLQHGGAIVRTRRAEAELERAFAELIKLQDLLREEGVHVAAEFHPWTMQALDIWRRAQARQAKA